MVHDRDLTNADHTYPNLIAGSPDRRIAGSPDRRIAGSLLVCWQLA